MNRCFCLVAGLLCLAGFHSSAMGVEPSFSTADVEYFEKEIRPILVARCYECHSGRAGKAKGGLRLDSRQAILAGGETGAAVDLEAKLEETLLIDAINYGDIYQMPPKSKLPAAEIAKLTEWVKRGMPWPREAAPGAPQPSSDFNLEERKQGHWAWQPIQNPNPPQVAGDEWATDSIDRFVLRKLVAANLKPAPEADRRTLIRRAYFDLLGLPPTPEQVNAFVEDASPKAFEHLVDGLLESPHFGERWARHWLDLVRYAESRGHEFDYNTPNAFQYRDYLIRALNADVPYDQFLTEHVAGDLLEAPRTDPQTGANESILGTGFWFMGEWVHSPVDIRKDEADRFDNMVDVFSKTFMGMTVACARCHDHKFDAISQKDYYALFGFLQSSAYRQVRFDSLAHNRRIARELQALQDEYAARVAQQFAAHLRLAAGQTKAYLLASREALQRGPKFGNADDRVFADFESGDYEGWRTEGEAFGTGPVPLKQIADYQGKINAVGKFVVNSHNVRRGATVKHGDQYVGKLISSEVRLDRNAIQFWIGGGAHQGKTCVNLIIDGKVVRTATGRNNNQMHLETWDVSEFRGKTARIEVVDQVQGGWGNIGIDQIVFTDQLRGTTHTVSADQFTDDYRGVINKIAKSHGLDAQRLARWVAHLIAAKKEPSDLLHPWSLAADATGSDVQGELTKVLQQLTQAAQPPKQPAETQVIFDVTQATQQPIRTDGVTFGLRPQRAGDLILSGDARQPIAAVAAYGAVRRVAEFRDLKLAGGVAKDSGRIGKWDRAGKTLRTDTFTIQHGQIAFLVRGKGVAYTVVDSHRMLNGPLHGSVLKEFNVPGDQPKWVVHNLGRYRGHGVHVEFTAVGRDDLEVLRVVDTTQGQPEFTGVTQHPLANLTLSDSRVETLAGAIEQRVQQAIESLGRRQFAAEDIAAASWIIQHEELFAEPQTEGLEIAKVFADKHKALTEQIKLESRTSMAMWDGNGVDEQLLIRGNVKTAGSVVPRGILSGIDVPSRDYGSNSGRLILAQQMVSRSNPLTSRVIVNRLWHHLFGQGIVASVDNLGVLGQRPTHPELLDHLAVGLMEDDWSLKRMIKRIMLSSTYRMSSVPQAEAEEIDPDNLLLHRMNIRRLQGEVIRDAVLSLSGRLDSQLYGPPVPVYLTPFMQGRGRPGSGPLDGNGRRSIYISIRRNFLSPMMMAFDTPQPFSTVGRRTVSNVPGQALIMMNNPLIVEQCQLWAKRLLSEPQTREERIRDLYESAFARPPSKQEVNAALAFLTEQASAYQMKPESIDQDARPWADLCHVLLNVKEFVFVN